MANFKPTYLYIKTHNLTGLKYFGKTTNKDPYTYKGSGTYWSNHLKVHGSDITTEIIGYYDNEKECRKVAHEFSITNDIVNSKEWANLKIEALDGGWDYVNENRLNCSENWSDESKENQRLAGAKNGNYLKENKIGIFGLTKEQQSINSKKGSIKSQEVIQKNMV